MDALPHFSVATVGSVGSYKKGGGRFAEELAIFIVDYSQKQSTGGFPRQSEDCLGMTGNRGLVRNDSVYFVDTLSKKRAAFAAL